VHRLAAVPFVLCAWAAVAVAEPALLHDGVARCEGIPPRSRVEPIGGDAFHIVTQGGDRSLVFVREEGCQRYPIGRAAARANGRFGKATKAYALVPPGCINGSCHVALAIRGKDELPLAALRTAADCDVEVELRPVALFPGRDAIELVCRGSSGAGWQESVTLFDVGTTLRPLITLHTGGYQALSEEERKAGDRPRCPIGSLRVEKVGERALLRVADPEAGDLEDGKGTIPARQLVYDPARGEFVPSGAPDVTLRVDAQAACKTRR
jgi:hypothetical protein